MKRRNARHHEGPTAPDPASDVRLTITADMASAIGPIAGQHSGTLTIWHAASVDPEPIWRVRVDEADASYLYLVDDESGTIDPEPGTYYDGHRVDSSACICDPDADGTVARGCPVHWLPKS